MELGVTFPRDGLRNDPPAMRDFAQAAESLGFGHLHAGDHVLGRAGLQDSARPIIDPFLLFAHLAAVTSRIRFVSGIMVLPQRQTVLVARQAANLDVISGGRLRLAFSVGWNEMEYVALNENFRNRGQRMDEQVAVMRRLWTEKSVTFEGRWHHIQEAGINPLPIQRPIPLWMAGYAESALRRVARLADGWFPQSPPGAAPGGGPEIVGETLERLRSYVAEAGRDPSTFGVNGTIRMADRTPADWRQSLEDWRSIGATHVTLNTIMPGDVAPEEHIRAIELFKREVDDLSTADLQRPSRES
jgi:probable F420-dependent oxidoreductase